MIFRTKFLICLATLATLFCGAQTVTNTLLNVDYESGTLNSGISGISSSHATAPDANYMVQPGATGSWAIAHKMVYGDNGYYSDGAFRSESDAIALSSARYFPGDERRYEFSVLLKDWTAWESGSTYETNVFQLKVSGNSTTDSGVPLQFRTARNAMRLRYVGSTSITDIITDLRPLVNQWLHFRVDVLWADGSTGYIKTYMKLPGQSDYTLVDEKTNYTTFAGDVSVGNIGYIKWGGYGLQEGLTRITYHDDIKIYELNNNSIPQDIWSNPITGSAINFTTPITTNNNTDAYLNNDGIDAPSFFYGSNTGGLNTAGAFSNRVVLNGWTIRASTAEPNTPFNSNQYFEFKVQPKNGYKINFSSFNFTARRGNVADPGMYAMRSSLDGFTNDITAPQPFSAESNIPTSLAIDLSALPDVNQPVTFRLYWYGTSRTAGVPLVGIDDFTFTGTIYYSDLNLQVPSKIDLSKNPNEFTVIVAPNPSKTEFNISITGDPVETVFVSIFDVSGRRTTVLKANPDQTITVGSDLIAGIYLAEITQGKNKKTVKLIKQ